MRLKLVSILLPSVVFLLFSKPSRFHYLLETEENCPIRLCVIGDIQQKRYILLKLTNDTSFLDDMLFSLFQKISFHRVGTYIYFTIQRIDCKAVSMLFPFRWLRPRITVKAISYPLAGIPQHWHCLASRYIFLYSVSGRNIPYDPMRKILNWML